MEPERIEAIRGGETFFKGKPCRRGHDGERYTNTGLCVSCERERVRSWAGKRRAYIKALREEGGND